MDNDIDNDGHIDSQEKLLVEQKLKTHRRMATASLTAMLAIPYLLLALLSVNVITPEDVGALSSLFGVFYVVNAGIVSAYFGVDAWMNKR